MMLLPASRHHNRWSNFSESCQWDLIHLALRLNGHKASMLELEALHLQSRWKQEEEGPSSQEKEGSSVNVGEKG